MNFKIFFDNRREMFDFIIDLMHFSHKEVFRSRYSRARTEDLTNSPFPCYVELYIS